MKIRKIPEQEVSFVAFHDAAWGNCEDPDIGSPEWTGEHPVSSQLAHVILICGAKLLDGEESDFSLIDWRSKRVCRSTFAGETMACCEALEHSIYLRSLFVSFAEGRVVSEADCGAYVPIHCITDCKSLYDHLLREGTPKAPTEKRLAIESCRIEADLDERSKASVREEAWSRSRTDSEYALQAPNTLGSH